MNSMILTIIPSKTKIKPPKKTNLMVYNDDLLMMRPVIVLSLKLIIAFKQKKVKEIAYHK